VIVISIIHDYDIGKKNFKKTDLKRHLSIPFIAYPKLKSSLKKTRLLTKPKLSYPILTLMLLLSLELLVKTPKVQLFSLNHGLLYLPISTKKNLILESPK
jgi:hypothetical protein